MSQCTVALSGLSDTDADTIAGCLDTTPGNRWALVDGTGGDVLIVDIDTVWGHMDWLRATANGQKVVAFTTDEKVRGCDLVLHKPLRERALVDVLACIEPAVSAVGEAASTPARPASRAEPEHEPLPTDPPAEVATASEPAPPLVQSPEHVANVEVAAELPPAMTLGEGLLADAVTWPVIVEGDDGVELRLDPERGGYTGPHALKPLQPLLDTLLEEVRPLDPDAVAQMREAPALPLTRLLWFAALVATPGALAPALDPQATYHLSRWPQIEREFPRHFRIATTMMKGPGTLGDIASSANAPIADVTDFINGYSVAGYVSCNAVQADNTQRAANNNGMFSRLRRPFSRSGPDVA